MVGNDAPSPRAIRMMANIIRIAAGCAKGERLMPLRSGEWCEGVSFAPEYLTSPDHGAVCICPQRRRESGELAVVDFGGLGSPMLALNVRIALRETIEPSIPGVGKVRVDFSPDGIVVMLAA